MVVSSLVGFLYVYVGSSINLILFSKSFYGHDGGKEGVWSWLSPNCNRLLKFWACFRKATEVCGVNWSGS